jgi:NADH-quinone oxidoreductase subunit M
MILVWLLVITSAGGILAWLAERWGRTVSRLVCLGALLLDLVLVLYLWAHHFGPLAVARHGPWLEELNRSWIGQLGISFHLGLDGLSLLLLLLTVFLGLVSVGASWTEIDEHVGFFHFQLMWVLVGIIGVFLALDLFLFFFFWEMMLVPMYFLIALWGHERRIYAAVKFFLFTQLSGLLMLIAILALYFIHGRNTGTYTFDYTQLLHTSLSSTTGMLLMLGFFAAFAVKLPAVPLHTWLPDAHTEAPTAGSVILAGLLLKTGAYGLFRFILPLFPVAAHDFAPIGMALGAAGILYGALLAFGQTDLKRLVAYTSVSHMGFVLLGVFAWNDLALQGAVMQILCHGIGTAALFILVGALQERIHTRDIRDMGGLWETMPRMGGVGLLFALAALGLPGLGNFVAEFLVLIGAYHANRVIAIVATLGLISATVYALWMIQAAFQGPNRAHWTPPDFGLRELTIMTALIGAIVWLGLYPRPVLSTTAPTVTAVQQRAPGAAAGSRAFQRDERGPTAAGTTAAAAGNRSAR